MAEELSHHQALIVDQFTQQARPFAELATHSQEDAFRLLLEAAAPQANDEVLDVACGPGLVACFLAPHVRHVTGVDLTPAMLEQARRLQAEKGLHNLSWRLSEAESLPFADGAFSLVVTRYALHHMPSPAACVAEMTRVCRHGGRIVIVDVYTTSAEQEEHYNRFEKLRDPSHARALRLEELQAMAAGAGMGEVRCSFYRLATEMESQLAASFPNPGDEERLREMLRQDVGRNQTGLEPYWDGERLRFSYPCVVLSGRVSHASER